MEEKRYMIKDASKVLCVEAHVLRYWEDELDINIPRNEMGHRYYTENHINLLKNVRNFKNQGYGLKAIKMMMKDPKDLPQAGKTDNKLEQFQDIMDKIVSKALKETAADIGKEFSDNISDNVLKGVDYIIRMQEEKEEERYRKLDEAVRKKQNISRKERKQKLKAEKLLLKKTKKKNLFPRFKEKPQTT